MKDRFKAGFRPVICMDGYYLKGYYKGHLLVDVGLDADECLYPLAFAIVDSECESAWTWFLDILKNDLELNNSHRISFMTDRKKMILEARDKGIITLVESIRSQLMQRIAKNRDESEKLIGLLCPKIQRKLDTTITQSRRCWPLRVGGSMYQVSCGPSYQHSVNIQAQTCSCRKWELTG
ncbi:hypothetical protein V6N13_098664 [Hibiscus sabdariffa]